MPEMRRRRGMDEKSVIGLARSIFGARRGSVRIGIGDDAALVRIGGADIVLTADSIVDGVDFDLRYFRWSDVGYKAVSAAVSDIYACGAIPRAILISAGLSSGVRAPDVRALMSGIAAAARRYGAPVVGGDTTKSSRTFIDVCVAGEPAIPGAFKSRSGARPGDFIYLSGPIGASRAALALFQKRAAVFGPLRAAHCRPIAPKRAGEILAREPRVTAMMDVSDGFLIDLSRLCGASGVSGGIAPSQVPLARGTAQAFRRLGRDPVREALIGGEDYVLMFCVRPPVPQWLAERFTCVGRILPRRRGSQGLIYNIEGRLPELVKVKGFLHRFA